MKSHFLAYYNTFSVYLSTLIDLDSVANKRGVQPETPSKRNRAQTKRQCPVKREKALAPAAPQPISHLVANKAQRVREKGKEGGYTINRACDNTNIYLVILQLKRW